VIRRFGAWWRSFAREMKTQKELHEQTSKVEAEFAGRW